MKYLKNVVKESMRLVIEYLLFLFLKLFFNKVLNFRLHSVIPANARKMQEDVLIDNYIIPKDVSFIFIFSYFS